MNFCYFFQICEYHIFSKTLLSQCPSRNFCFNFTPQYIYRRAIIRLIVIMISVITYPLSRFSLMLLVITFLLFLLSLQYHCCCCSKYYNRFQILKNILEPLIALVIMMTDGSLLWLLCQMLFQFIIGTDQINHVINLQILLVISSAIILTMVQLILSIL